MRKMSMTVGLVIVYACAAVLAAPVTGESKHCLFGSRLNTLYAHNMNCNARTTFILSQMHTDSDKNNLCIMHRLHTTAPAPCIIT